MDNFKNEIVKRQLFFSNWSFLPSYILIYLLSVFEILYNLISNIFQISKKDKIERYLLLIKIL